MPMNTRRFPASVSVILIPVLCCLVTGPAVANPLCPRQHEPIVGVSGTHLTLDGRVWLPRGVQLRGFTAPLHVAQDNAAAAVAAGGGSDNGWQKLVEAQKAYGNAELAAARSWGVDEIRFLVSQPSLDPMNTEKDAAGNPLFIPDYKDYLIHTINQARCAGFVVILAMQDEKTTGTADHQNLPTAATERAWNALLPAFGSAPDVVLELYNEPSLKSTDANWVLWAHASDAEHPTPQNYIGMGPLLRYLRDQGSQNVYVLDGLQEAATLEGIPTLPHPPTDPLGKLVYGVHPYPRGSANPPYDTQFGNISRSLPVFATEWSAGENNGSLGLGSLPNYDVAVSLLNYLTSHVIPLSAGAYDIPGVMPTTVPGWQPSNYNDYDAQLGRKHSLDNAGLLVRKLFQANYRTSLTAADGVTP